MSTQLFAVPTIKSDYPADEDQEFFDMALVSAITNPIQFKPKSNTVNWSVEGSHLFIDVSELGLSNGFYDLAQNHCFDSKLTRSIAVYNGRIYASNAVEAVHRMNYSVFQGLAKYMAGRRFVEDISWSKEHSQFFITFGS